MVKKVQQEINISEVIKRRRYNIIIRESYKSLLIRIIFLGLVGYLLFAQVFMLIRNNGMGMFPAIKDGDLVLIYRLQRDYEKEDVVVYEVDGTITIGRIIARETDIVTMDDSGTLKVNGTTQSGEIVFPTLAKDGITYPYTVPEGTVFILGDYRTQTKDSRDYGPIDKQEIKGKVITLLRRRGL